MAEFDYVITVGADADAIVTNSLEKFGEVKKAIEGESVSLSIKPNQKDLSEIIKEISSLDLKTNLNIKIDNSEYQKALKSLEGFSGKSAKNISNLFKNEITSGFKTLNIKQLLDSELDGRMKTSGAVLDLVKNLQKDLNFDISPDANYDDILKQAQAIEKLNRVITEVQATNIRGIKKGTNSFSIGDDFVFNIKDFEANYKKYFNDVGKYLQSNLSTLISSVQKDFESSRSNLMNLLSGGGSGNIKLDLSADIEKAASDLEKANKKLKDASAKINVDSLEKKIISLSKSLSSGKLSETDYDKQAANLLAYVNKYEQLGGQLKSLSANIRETISETKEYGYKPILDVDLDRYENAQKEVAELEKQLSSLRAFSGELTDNIADSSGSDSKEVEHLKNEIESLNKQLSESKGELDSVTQKFEEQKNAVKSLSTEIESLKNKSDKFDSMKQELDEATRRTELYHAAVRELNDELDYQRGKIASLDGKDVSADELATQTQKASELEVQLKRINALYEQQQVTLTELRQKVNDLSAENKALDAEAKDNDAAAKGYKSDLDVATEKLAEQTRLLAEQTAEVERLRAAFDGINNALTDARKALKEVKFDPYEQANKQLAQYATTGDREHWDKAAAYYGIYRNRNKNNKKNIVFEKENRDVSKELYARYRELRLELEGTDEVSLRNLLNEQGALVFATRERCEALEAEVAALKKKEEAEKAAAKAQEAALEKQKAATKASKAEETNKNNEKLLRQAIAKRKQKTEAATIATTPDDKTATTTPSTPDSVVEKGHGVVINKGQIKSDIEEAIKSASATPEIKIDSNKIKDDISNAISVSADEVSSLNKLEEKISDVTKNVKSKTGEFDIEKATVNSAVHSEVSDLDLLISKINEVKNKINEKTEAFRKEQGVVEAVVNSESQSLTALSGWITALINNINKLSQEIKQIPDISIKVDQVDSSKIDNEFIDKINNIKTIAKDFDLSNLNQVANTIKGLNIDESAGSNLQSFANAFLTFKSNLNNFSDGSKEILASINELLSKTNQLKDLATILSSTKSKIDAATAAVQAQQKMPYIPLDSDEIKNHLPVWKQLYGSQLNNISAVQRSGRNTKDGYAISYKLTGFNGKTITVGKNGDIVADKARYNIGDTDYGGIDNNVIQDSVLKKYAEVEAVIRSIYTEQSKLNELMAKQTLGELVGNEISEQYAKVEQLSSAIEAVRINLGLLQDAADHGYIDKSVVNGLEQRFDTSLIGSGKSLDAMEKAIVKQESDKRRKEELRIWDEAHAENKRIDEERRIWDEAHKENRKFDENKRRKEELRIWDEAHAENARIDKERAAKENHINSLLEEQASLLERINKLRADIAKAKYNKDVASAKNYTEQLRRTKEKYRNNSDELSKLEGYDDSKKTARRNQMRQNYADSEYFYTNQIAGIDAKKLKAEASKNKAFLDQYKKNLKSLEQLEKKNKSGENPHVERELTNLYAKLLDDFRYIESLYDKHKISAEQFDDVAKFKKESEELISRIREGTVASLGANDFKDAKTGFETLANSAKRYYSLLEKKREGKVLTAGERMDLERLDVQFRNAAEAVDIYGKELSETDKKAKNLYKERAELAKQSVKDAYIQRLSSSHEDLLSDQDNRPKAYAEQLDVLKSKISELETLLPIDEMTTPDQYAQIDKLDSEVKTLISDLKSSSQYKFADDSSINKLEKDILNWRKSNGAAIKEFGGQLDGIIAKLNAGKLTGEELQTLRNNFLEVQLAAQRAGKVGASFGDRLIVKFKELAAYLMSFASFYDVINIGRKAINVVTELDNALTEMRKVSDEPLHVLKEYQGASFDIAGTVGTTAEQLQQSTADWQRLGESFEKAKQSAKDSTILLNVSEFDNIDSATESLVAMSQAYQELDKIEIIDKLNNIGNNFSISTNDLATALQKSAAVLKTQGNDINEAIALITAGNAIGQDSDSTAAGIRTISLRIAGTEEAKQELSDLGEDVEDYIVQTSSKTDEIIRKYTAVASNQGAGVSVLDDNGNLRDTYNILLDISKIYKEIQKEDIKYGTNRASALVEVLAGKNRSNIAASILQNGDLLESVYNSAQTSEGSSQQELDKYLDSVTGKITQLQNKLQELAFVVVDSEALKVGIDLLTDIVSLVTNLIDNFGLLNTAISLAIGALTTKKGFGKQIVVYNAPFYKAA